MTNTNNDGAGIAARMILHHMAFHAMGAFVEALEARGTSYAKTWMEDSGAAITRALAKSEPDLVAILQAELDRGRTLDLRGTEVAPRMRELARDHGARVAAQFLIDRGAVLS